MHAGSQPRPKCSTVSMRHSGVCVPNVLLRVPQLDNMMVDGSWPRPVLKLCDFGFSKQACTDACMMTICGTPEYMAPEVRPPSCQQLQQTVVDLAHAASVCRPFQAARATALLGCTAELSDRVLARMACRC